MNPDLDKTTRRLADKCERIKEELVAALPKANAKEEAVLCELALETMQLGNRLALFRQRVRTLKPSTTRWARTSTRSPV